MVNAADLPVAAFMLADHPDDVLPFSFDSFFVRTQQQPAGDLSPCAKTGLNAPKVVSVMTIFRQLRDLGFPGRSVPRPSKLGFLPKAQ